MTTYSKALHAAGSELERTLAFHMRAERITGWVQEYEFCPTRAYRFDFAFPALMLAIECEGGTKGNGRHNRAAGFEEDCHKYNQAVVEGWRVLRFTSDMIMDGRAILTIKRAIKELSKGAVHAEG